MDSSLIEDYDILKGRAKAKVKKSLVSSTVSQSTDRPSIKLNADLYNKKFVISQGNERYNFNKENLINPYKYELNPNADIIGVLGELAFEKLTGLPMDKRIGIRDDKDFSVYDLKIDVKATESSDYLRIKLRRLSTSNLYYYVFTRVNLETFDAEFIGCLKGSQIKLKGRIWPDDPDWYKVHERYLDDMSVLKDELIKRNALNGTGIWR